MIEEIFDKIKKSKRCLLLTHHNADIDAISSCVALFELTGRKHDIGVPSSISRGAQDIAEDYNIKREPELSQYDTLVIVDCASRQQLRPLNLEDFNGIIILIDHHEPGDIYKMAEMSVVKKDAISTAEIIYEAAVKLDCGINKNAAKNIICGIVSDSAHLRLADSKHFLHISKLLDIAEINYNGVLQLLRTPTTRSEKIARIKALKRMECYKLNDLILVFSEIGSFEASVARSLLKSGADIAVVASERKSELRISARCKKDVSKKIHLVNDIFKPIEKDIDGSVGGHISAASSNGKNKDYKKIFEKMLVKFENKLGVKSKKL